MKKLALLVVAVVAAGWWYFVGGRKLSEDHVNRFYQTYEAATLERKPEIMCSHLADDYQSTGTITVAGLVRTDSQRKAEACESLRKLYESWEKLGEKMGGLLQLDSSYTIHSIEIAPDGKTATVDVSSSLDVGGSLMKLRSRSTDTLVRRSGKVLLLRSDSKSTFGGPL